MKQTTFNMPLSSNKRFRELVFRYDKLADQINNPNMVDSTATLDQLGRLKVDLDFCLRSIEIKAKACSILLILAACAQLLLGLLSSGQLTAHEVILSEFSNTAPGLPLAIGTVMLVLIYFLLGFTKQSRSTARMLASTYHYLSEMQDLDKKK